MLNWFWSLALVILTACSATSPTESSFYRFSISEKVNHTKNLPNRYELLSTGKLVFLSDLYNIGAGLSQQYYFIELNPQQMDSSARLISDILNSTWRDSIKLNDTTAFYSVRLESINNKGNRALYMGMGSAINIEQQKLLSYIQQIVATSKHYKLKHAYYFATDEVCYHRPEYHSNR